MKKYTHAWLSFMAIKRLEQSYISQSNQKYSSSLIEWFKNHNDDVIQGAWYPDAIIKDMSTSHIYKFTPSNIGNNYYGCLPTSYNIYREGKNSALYNTYFKLDSGNLPYRCEAIAHSIIDNLKMKESEDKGSPICPTNNHIANLFFMLSHYIADAHVPFHCDSRKFSSGVDIHAKVEGIWEDYVKDHYLIDQNNKDRFEYDGIYPKLDSSQQTSYNNTILPWIDLEIQNRNFYITWGSGNDNVLEFMQDICHYSYLCSHLFIPTHYDHLSVTNANWDQLQNNISFDDLSKYILIDAIDSIARVWLRVWRKYQQWL